MKIKLVKDDVEYVVSDPVFIYALKDAGYEEVETIGEFEPVAETVTEPVAEAEEVVETEDGKAVKK